QTNRCPFRSLAQARTHPLRRHECPRPNPSPATTFKILVGVASVLAGKLREGFGSRPRLIPRRSPGRNPAPGIPAAVKEVFDVCCIPIPEPSGGITTLRVSHAGPLDRRDSGRHSLH